MSRRGQRQVEPLSADISCLTDGSKTYEVIGAGIYRSSPDEAYSISLKNLNTIFQTEVHAIDTCGWMLEKQQPTRK